MPVPPLDGFSVLKGILPKAAIGFHDMVASHPALRWGGIILAWFAFPFVGRPVFQFITRLLGS
jgi:Zn-dependent protease